MGCASWIVFKPIRETGPHPAELTSVTSNIPTLSCFVSSLHITDLITLLKLQRKDTEIQETTFNESEPFMDEMIRDIEAYFSLHLSSTRNYKKYQNKKSSQVIVVCTVESNVEGPFLMMN